VAPVPAPRADTEDTEDTAGMRGTADKEDTGCRPAQEDTAGLADAPDSAGPVDKADWIDCSRRLSFKSQPPVYFTSQPYGASSPADLAGGFGGPGTFGG
jgi:hypothetical protein